MGALAQRRQARTPAMTRAVAIVVAAMLTLLIPAAVTAQETAPLVEREIRSVLADILSDGGYQQDLPDTRPPEPLPHIPEPREEGGLSIPPEVFYVAVAIAAILIVVYLANEVPFLARRWRRDTRDGVVRLDGNGEPLDSASYGPTGLDQADALAAAGDHTGAVRVLLLSVFDFLAARAGDDIPPALTSREILRRADLTGPGKDAVLSILATEEQSYFGGYPINFDTYDLCRSQFLIFSGGVAGPGATEPVA